MRSERELLCLSEEMLSQGSVISGKWESESFVPGRGEFVVLFSLIDGKFNRKFKSKDWDFLSVQCKLTKKIQKSKVLLIYVS